MSSLRYFTCSLFVALALSACGSTSVDSSKTAVANSSTTTTTGSSGASGSTAGTSAVPGKTLEAHLDPSSLISKDRSIYFELDDYSVDPKFLSMMQVHGRYLAATPGLNIRVEGHADERGGTEYNLALGQKRADAVTKLLKSYGVKTTQLESISFGKEKPKSMGHDEAAWAQNRRVDLSYPTK